MLLEHVGEGDVLLVVVEGNDRGHSLTVAAHFAWQAIPCLLELGCQNWQSHRNFVLQTFVYQWTCCLCRFGQH